MEVSKEDDADKTGEVGKEELVFRLLTEQDLASTYVANQGEAKVLCSTSGQCVIA